MLNWEARQLLAAWRAAKGDREVPQRAGIDPVSLGAALPAVFLLDSLSADQLRIRLAGSPLCALYGRELRGSNFLEFWRGDCRRTVRALIPNLLAMPAAGILDTRVELLSGPAIDMSVFLLPLADDQGEPTLLIGTANPGPRILSSGDAPVVRQMLRGIRLLDPDQPGPAAAEDTGAPGILLRFPHRRPTLVG
ncbi:MAG: PAS domain-containing protein [Alphaproteobacteria bacterium]|nr:PAS domain-containing protein [Alphaproteobacteria bacterium]